MPLSLPETIRVLLPNGNVRKLPLEEYVRGVVAAALPEDAPLEAMKVHAVAARTFGASTRRHIERGADVCTLRHCQAWKEHASAAAARATGATRGIVAVYGGRLIDAYYFEHCDGNTRDATGLLMQPPPYLRGVACVCGFAALKGHGIGMCQRGAMVMARFGDKFDVILKHYYSGITLERVGVLSGATPPPPLPPASQEPPLDSEGPRASQGDEEKAGRVGSTFNPLLASPAPNAGSALEEQPPVADQKPKTAALAEEPPKVLAPAEEEARVASPEEEKPKSTVPVEEPPKVLAPPEEEARVAAAAEEEQGVSPARAVEPSAGPPVPVQVPGPKAPKRAPRTKKHERTSKPPHAKKTARTLSSSPRRRTKGVEDKEKLSFEPEAALTETAKAEQAGPALQTEIPVAVDVVTHMPPAVKDSVVKLQKPLEAVPAPTPSQEVPALGVPESQLLPVPVPAEVAEAVEPLESLQVPAVPETIEATRGSTNHEVEAEIQMPGEVGWYPVAEEIASGADKLQAELLDEALEVSAATFVDEVASTRILFTGTASKEVGGTALPERESTAAASVQELAKLPPAPETMPEEMPIFPVVSAAVESPLAAPVPPLFEEEVAETHSEALSPQVLIDHLPGPRMIAGDLSKPGTIITIRDEDGHAVITVSGAAPYHGAGGFEAPLASDGAYLITFDHHALRINLKDETVFVSYPG